MKAPPVSVLAIPPIFITPIVGLIGALIRYADFYGNPQAGAEFYRGFGYGMALGLVSWYLWPRLVARWFPSEQVVKVVKPAPDPQPPKYQPINTTGSTLRRDPIESIHHDKAVKVAYKIRAGATVSHGKLGSILSRIEIGDLQVELVDKNMAIWRNSDHRGGIELLDKGYDAFEYYLPHPSYKHWLKHSDSLYTHNSTHTP